MWGKAVHQTMVLCLILREQPAAGSQHETLVSCMRLNFVDISTTKGFSPRFKGFSELKFFAGLHFMRMFQHCFNCYYCFLVLGWGWGGGRGPGKHQQTYGLQTDIKTFQCKDCSHYRRCSLCLFTISSSSKPANSCFYHKMLIYPHWTRFTLTLLARLHFGERYLRSEQNFTLLVAFCIHRQN